MVGETYTAFGFAIIAVAAPGLLGIPDRPGIGRSAIRNVNALTTIVVSLMVATLLSFAFLADRLPDAAHPTFVPGNSLNTAAGWVAQSVLLGDAGLLCMIAGLVMSDVGWVRRWAGGCLVASCLWVLALTPLTVLLILETVEATPA